MESKSVVTTHIEVQIENRNRQTALFRWILAAPIALILFLLTQMVHYGLTTVVIVLPVVLTLLVRGVYPSWMLTYNHAVMEFATRVVAYVFLLTDNYPSLEPHSKIAVIFPDIEGGKKLSRGLPLVKWIFAIPLYLVGAIYLLLSIVMTIFAWIVTSATGRYPNSALKIVYGTIQFWNRVYGYCIALVTDDYPPFTL